LFSLLFIFFWWILIFPLNLERNVDFQNRSIWDLNAQE
jgi:hypothetical protein